MLPSNMSYPDPGQPKPPHITFIFLGIKMFSANIRHFYALFGLQLFSFMPRISFCSLAYSDLYVSSPIQMSWMSNQCFWKDSYYCVCFCFPRMWIMSFLFWCPLRNCLVTLFRLMSVHLTIFCLLRFLTILYVAELFLLKRFLDFTALAVFLPACAMSKFNQSFLT